MRESSPGSPRFFSSAASGAPPLELHPSTSIEALNCWTVPVQSTIPYLYLYRFDAPASPLIDHGKPPGAGCTSKRVAHRRSFGRVYLKHCEWSEWARSAIHRTLGMKPERGAPHRRKAKL